MKNSWFIENGEEIRKKCTDVVNCKYKFEENKVKVKYGWCPEGHRKIIEESLQVR